MRVQQLRPQLERAAAVVKNDDLITFLHEYVSERGLSEERVETTTKWLGRVLVQLDARLKDHGWLSGDSLSLADIAWCIDIHRFQLMRFPMPHTALLSWYGRMEVRPSFKKMVVDYEAQVLNQVAAAQRIG